MLLKISTFKLITFHALINYINQNKEKPPKAVSLLIYNFEFLIV